MGCVTRFPVESVMPSEVAEQKLGGIVLYQFRSELLCDDPQGWLEKWMEGRSVLAGWESVKSGIVKSFRAGRVRHIVSRTRRTSRDKGERPKVELCCSLDVHSVFNWKSEQRVAKNPVIVLSYEQAPYFRPCQKCQAVLMRILEGRR